VRKGCEEEGETGEGVKEKEREAKKQNTSFKYCNQKM